MLKFLIIRNVHVRQGRIGMIKFNYSVFQKLIGTSCLIKNIQYSVFGHTHPRTHPDSDVQPPCPFTVHPDDASYMRAVRKIHQLIEGTGSVELEEALKFEFDFKSEQYEELFSLGKQLDVLPSVI